MIPGPFLRYAGGKTRALPAILPLIPPTINGKYREIFLGGGAVFFALVESSPRTLDLGYALSDINADLIACYQRVQKDPVNVISHLELCASQNSEQFFYRVRSDYNAGRHVGPNERAAWFIYLNRTCFNGLHRVNANGGFNVPWGKLKNPDIVQEEKMLWCSRALQGAELRCESFEQALARADRGDFVYADPPYLDPDPNAFTGYTGKFSATEAQFLSSKMRALQESGVAGLISNADNALTRGIFTTTKRRVTSLDVRRSVGASASTRKAAPEILVECFPC